MNGREAELHMVSGVGIGIDGGGSSSSSHNSNIPSIHPSPTSRHNTEKERL